MWLVPCFVSELLVSCLIFGQPWVGVSVHAAHMQVEATAKSVLGLYQRAIASADLLPSDKEDLERARMHICGHVRLCSHA